MKTKTFILEYREKREKKHIEITIEDTSNWADREYRWLKNEIANIQSAYIRCEQILKERSILLVDGKNGVEGWKDKIKILDEEESKIEELFKSYNKQDYYSRRFELLKDVLEFNGCKQEFLYDYDFWDRNISQGETIRFIEFVFNEEVETKKQGGKPKK